MNTNMTAEMMQNMSMDAIGMPAMDAMTMQACIEACSACEQACTMCADNDMADGMIKCASMCMDCADVSNTMMRMLMRPSGFDMTAMQAMLRACMAMCSACADECGNHAEMSETCRMCAMACTECMNACQAMLDMMRDAETV
nr:hypothetical protein [Planctomonas sp. JC2975]